MPLPLAFIVVILIWTTTPLAIKWSGEGAGFLFGVTARMGIGAAVCLLVLRLLRHPLPRHRNALRLYLAAGLGGYGAMVTVYWGASYVPSGWVAVIYGLTPIFTSVLSALWLREQSLTPAKLLGMGVALAGLWVIFGHAAGHSDGHQVGLYLVTGSALLHAISSIWVKRLGRGLDLSALTLTTGSLLLVVPLYILTWWLLGDPYPPVLAPRAWVSIVYLGVVATVVGFILYYYLLQRVGATSVALINVVTPVTALLAGAWLNAEEISHQTWLGAGLVVGGLAIYQLRRPVIAQGG